MWLGLPERGGLPSPPQRSVASPCDELVFLVVTSIGDAHYEAGQFAFIASLPLQLSKEPCWAVSDINVEEL